MPHCMYMARGADSYYFAEYFLTAENEMFLKSKHFMGVCQFQIILLTGKCLNEPFLFFCFVLIRHEHFISIT